MRSPKGFFSVILVLVLALVWLLPVLGAEKTELVINNMSLANKKIFREKLIKEMIQKFRDDNTIAKIHEYMVEKAQELNIEQPDRLPDFLIQETFAKTDNLFERTRFIVKNNSFRFYEPDSFEKTVQKLLWLKGVCFLVMGISEEHKMAFSYFYLPGNEAVRSEFLEDMVEYSFPEVPDIPENRVWHIQMTEAMSRLGYNIFSVEKFGIKNVQVKSGLSYNSNGAGVPSTHWNN